MTETKSPRGINLNVYPTVPPLSILGSPFLISSGWAFSASGILSLFPNPTLDAHRDGRVQHKRKRAPGGRGGRGANSVYMLLTGFGWEGLLPQMATLFLALGGAPGASGGRQRFIWLRSFMLQWRPQMLPPPLLFLIHVCLSESGGKEPGGQCGAACLGSDSHTYT